MPYQPNSKPSILHRIVDRLLPNNCRSQLKEAAAENRQVSEEALCMLRTVKQDIIKKVSNAA